MEARCVVRLTVTLVACSKMQKDIGTLLVIHRVHKAEKQRAAFAIRRPQGNVKTLIYPSPCFDVRK